MEPKMKILYVITKSDWGGAQRYVYDLSTRLDAGRFDIAVGCGGNGPLVEKLGHAGIRAIPLPALERDIRPGRELSVLWQLFRLIRRERPDIVHLSSSKAGGLGAVAALGYKLLTVNPFDKLGAGRKPLTVFTVHGWPFAEDRPAWQRGLIFFFSWLSTVFADYVIVIDAADYRAGRRFIPEAKLVLVPHGIAPPEFLPRGEARAFLTGKIRTGAPGEDGIILGVTAELTRNKGLDYLIDAVNQVKLKVKSLKCKVIVMGEGEERTALERQIERLGLGDTIFLIGFLPEAARYLKGLDAFILPSVKEGLPYAVMEAMAAGLPVIASAVGGIPDLIQPEKTGILVPPKNPAALAEAIIRIVAEPHLGRAIGRRAQAAITEESSRDAMLAGTIAIYRNS